MRYLLLIVGLLVAPWAGAAEVSFPNDVMAVMSRAGCNMGACHGNLNGKGGFRLSLRGENAALDFQTLTRDALARRVDVARPASSLLLQKATGQVPHEGGVRFSPTSLEYRLIHDWIASGAQFREATKPVKLTVTPSTAIVVAPQDRVTIRATVTFADGSTKPITDLVSWELNNVGVAKVEMSGEVVRESDGETVVLVRYLDQLQPVRIAFIPDRPKTDLSSWAKKSRIDQLTAQKWAELRIQPSDKSSDAVFLRRVYLDTCGILPTPEEARGFFADTAPDKRAKLIDRLLERPEFAQYWATKWGDLLRNEEKSLDKKGVQVFHRWIKGWIAEDKPWSDFAREILAARGSTYQNPPTNFYRAIREPYQRAESVAQVFLGLRVSCAKCHNHPFDRWTQDDYHRFAATFARIGYRVPSNEKRDDLDKHEFVGEQFVTALLQGDLPHPTRGGMAKPKFLGTNDDGPEAERLTAFADWVADPANPFFARTQVNRIWLQLLGRGLVDPNDDFRLSNPPTNPELLDYLTTQFRAGGFRIKGLMREILNSETYQLSEKTNATNANDALHFSHSVIQPLEAEQLLDAMSVALKSELKFPGYPTGMRAMEIPAPPQREPRRGKEAMGMRFLKVFGKPDRLITCECERSEDPGMLQSFQLITGRLVHDLLRNADNRLGNPNLALDDLYLATVTRFPTDTERQKLQAYLAASKDRRQAWEDIAWGLFNSKEFLVRK
ncbi:MAG: DUF1549 and DUF1553 domain-containing protein [Fimbriiglobus sp.]